MKKAVYFIIFVISATLLFSFGYSPAEASSFWGVFYEKEAQILIYPFPVKNYRDWNVGATTTLSWMLSYHKDTIAYSTSTGEISYIATTTARLMPYSSYGKAVVIADKVEGKANPKTKKIIYSLDWKVGESAKGVDIPKGRYLLEVCGKPEISCDYRASIYITR